MPRVGGELGSVCSVVCIFFPWFRFRGLHQSNSSTSNSNSFALLRRRMARRTVLWAVALPRLETLVVVREGACGCLGGTCGSVLHVRVTQGGTRSGGACCETICALCSRCRRRERADRGGLHAWCSGGADSGVSWPMARDSRSTKAWSCLFEAFRLRDMVRYGTP